MSQVADEKSVGPTEVKSGIIVHRKYPHIDEALSIFEHKEITKEQIATYLGWSETSKKYMTLLWGIAFNKSEIYLSPELINDYLGYKGKVSNFYKNTLYPGYIKDKHYFEVGEDHPLIIAYSNSQGADPLLGKIKHSGGLETKNYTATGWAFKMMMMAARTAKSKELHEYYLDVEEMADFNISYSNALRVYIQDLETKMLRLALQQETTLRIEADAKTKGLDQRNAIVDQFVQAQSIKKVTGCLYIGTTPQDLLVNHFKLGITENLEKRLAQYTKTFSTPANRFFYCDYIPLHEPKIVENASKIVLRSYHLNDEDRTRQDETYILNYDVLHKIVSLLCTNHTGVIELVNALLDTYKDDIFRPSVVVPKPLPKALLCIEMKITTGDQSITIPLDLDEMTEAEGVEACKTLINSYVRAKTQHKAYDIATDEKEAIEPRIKIELGDLEKFIKESLPHGKKGKVKMPAWRRIIASTFAGIKNIDYHGKKTKAK